MSADRAGMLAGARILVTRPAHQAEELCAAIAAAGGVALRLPLFTIVPAAGDAALQQRLDAVRSADWWLFTSANAGATALRLSPPPWRARVAAVGPATAATLNAGGITDIVVPPADYSGAALAALPNFVDAAGREFAILTGEDGRSELADALRARGGHVTVVPLYRREPLAHAAETVATLIGSCDAIVVTSQQGLQRLLTLTPAHGRKELLRKPLLVPSPRVVEHAHTMGFLLPPLLPERMTDAAIVDALVRWRHAQR